MRSPFMRAAAVLALMACSVLAQAQSEAPGRVGRVSLVQGPVTISTEDGDQPDSALDQRGYRDHAQGAPA